MSENIFSKYTERYDAVSFNNYHITPDKKKSYNDQDIIFDNTNIYSTKTYESGYNIVGDVGYMCPNCFNIEHISTSVKNNADLIFKDKTDDEIDEIESMNIFLNTSYSVNLKCPICKYQMNHIQLDNNIADAIGILNIKGYYTDYCCEGHGSKGPYISFGKMLTVYPMKTISKIESYLENTLPISWYVSRTKDRGTYTYVPVKYSKMKTETCSMVREVIPPKYGPSFIIRGDAFNKEECLKDITKLARSLIDLKKEGLY